MKTKIKPVLRSELDEMLHEAIYQVKNIGIELDKEIIPEVRVYAATSYFGLIRYHRKLDKYRVTISEYHLKHGYQPVMETIVHEVLHAAKGAKGHSKQWQQYAAIVNDVYDYNISRMQSYDQGYRLPKNDRKIKYIIECTNCDVVYRRQRMSRLVSQTDRYVCSSCGSELARTK